MKFSKRKPIPEKSIKRTNTIRVNAAKIQPYFFILRVRLLNSFKFISIPLKVTINLRYSPRLFLSIFYMCINSSVITKEIVSPNFFQEAYLCLKQYFIFYKIKSRSYSFGVIEAFLPLT